MIQAGESIAGAGNAHRSGGGMTWTGLSKRLGPSLSERFTCGFCGIPAIAQ